MKCIDDYINGNLSDAKRAAKRYSVGYICEELFQDYGKPREAALAIARYLKGEISFQSACETENAFRKTGSQI